jgi:hypothetical protein
LPAPRSLSKLAKAKYIPLHAQTFNICGRGRGLGQPIASCIGIYGSLAEQIYGSLTRQAYASKLKLIR